MKRFDTHPIGIEQGDVVLFSDFEDGGEMWTGTGPRERCKSVTFSETFQSTPVVQISISLWDVDTATALRAEVVAKNVSSTGFDIVFRTWADTRIARIRASWSAIGPLPNEDDWEIF